MIGKGGCNIKAVREQCRVYVSVLKTYQEVDDRVMTVKGSVDCIANAISKYATILLEAAQLRQSKHAEAAQMTGAPTQPPIERYTMKILIHSLQVHTAPPVGLLHACIIYIAVNSTYVDISPATPKDGFVIASVLWPPSAYPYLYASANIHNKIHTASNPAFSRTYMRCLMQVLALSNVVIHCILCRLCCVLRPEPSSEREAPSSETSSKKLAARCKSPPSLSPTPPRRVFLSLEPPPPSTTLLCACSINSSIIPLRSRAEPPSAASRTCLLLAA